MTKKRFFVVLGISIIIWSVSSFIQIFVVDGWQLGFSLLGGSCTVTGYPLAFCLPEQQWLKVKGLYAVNIVFWFWAVHLSWRRFKKRTD